MYRSRTRTAKDRRTSARHGRRLHLEALEARNLLSSSPLVVPLPATGPNDVTLSLSAGELRVVNTLGGGVVASQALGATSSIIVQGADNVGDTLHIDYSGGLFGVNVSFGGGAGAG